ncbi:TetR/AcrR family transcriptional regulator [Amycolatopsis sp. SID8362]|uniref:TetR/AcrR family transcriptional regulator n=1 Tax=Amycolatopsis sp. SID8362 TaxID=2690346 RepID=UPI00136C42B9|nr:TetR/AcrR family transcriptional regulator [Amycolatopsis sp. SID8362]NBH02567.1 TetR family transcriptional regulator [Amycolatopsis sp. SID8362]NED39269.1 TetR family transcriptional regulator [Amycolatopsis sp. SID8362]
MREEIVDAAVEEFHARGFNGTGVKVITDTAGVPKGSFYNHFESKEALAVVALERYGATMRLEDLADRTVEPLERLRRHFEYLRAKMDETNLTRGCLFGNFGSEIVDHSRMIRTAVQRSLKRWSSAVAAVLAECVKRGDVDAGIDPQETAVFIVSAWEGALISARAGRSGAAFDAFFSLVFGRLLRPAQDA